jgi:hypothetical protein
MNEIYEEKTRIYNQNLSKIEDFLSNTSINDKEKLDLIAQNVICFKKELNGTN